MDMSKEEMLGSIQRLTVSERQKRGDLIGQREKLAEINEGLPASNEIADLTEKLAGARDRLKEQQLKSSEYKEQKVVVLEAKADYDTAAEALSNMLVMYMVKTKKKAVHAFASEPVETDREIVTSARIGSKVAANLSLFGEEEE